MNSRTGCEIFLVLMVIGNIPIIYQKESEDAQPKMGVNRKNLDWGEDDLDSA